MGLQRFVSVEALFSKKTDPGSIKFIGASEKTGEFILKIVQTPTGGPGYIRNRY